MLLQLPKNRHEAAIPAFLMFAAMLALVVFLATGAFGQCPGGQCGIPGRNFASPMYFISAPLSPPAATFTQAPAEPKWFQHTDGDWYLYRGARQVAGYRTKTGEYLPMLADGQWADKWPPNPPPGIVAAKAAACQCGAGCACGQDPCTCIAAASVPAQPQTVPPVSQNFGLDLGEMQRHKKLAYSGPDGKISREEAVAALTLVDDTTGRLGYVVAVGADGVAKDWTEAATLAPFREQFAFQSYKADDVMPSKLGYGSPGVYVVPTSGQAVGPLAYQGPDKLGGLLDSIKNPKAPLIPPIEPKIDLNIPSWVWLIGVGLLGYLFGSKRQPVKP